MGTADAGRYTLYLDESGDHGLFNFNPSYPVLALCGVAAENSYYSRTLLPYVDRFKVDQIGSASYRLHYRAMAQKAGPYRFLADSVRAWTFEQALAGLISDLEVAVFCAVIVKDEYLARYGPTRPVDQYLPTNLYLMALDFVLERFVKYLEERGPSQGNVLAEARGRREDEEVHAEYSQLLQTGTQFVSGERFRRALGPDLRFADKNEGVAGLELADICAPAVATQILKPRTPSPIWDAVSAKIWVSAGSRRGSLGLKRFPRSATADPLFKSLGRRSGEESPGGP